MLDNKSESLVEKFESEEESNVDDTRDPNYVKFFVL